MMAMSDGERSATKMRGRKKYLAAIKAGKIPCPPSLASLAPGYKKLTTTERGEIVKAAMKRKRDTLARGEVYTPLRPQWKPVMSRKGQVVKSRGPYKARGTVGVDNNQPSVVLAAGCKHCPNCGFNLQLVNEAIAVTTVL